MVNPVDSNNKSLKLRVMRYNRSITFCKMKLASVSSIASGELIIFSCIWKVLFVIFIQSLPFFSCSLLCVWMIGLMNLMKTYRWPDRVSIFIEMAVTDLVSICYRLHWQAFNSLKRWTHWKSCEKVKFWFNLLWLKHSTNSFIEFKENPLCSLVLSER